MNFVVTSFSSAGMAAYGKRAIESFHEFWPSAFRLLVVSEDAIELPPAILDGRRKVEFIPLQDHDAAVAFYERHKNNLRAQGRSRANAYDFRMDAWKFSKKVFAIDLASKRIGHGNNKLIWLDADTVTFAPVPADLFVTMPPAMCALACLDRGRYHSECGFVSYNLGHAKGKKFIAAFADLYASDAVFNLKEWHDSFVFDWLRKRDNIPTYRIPHKSQGHPFVHSALGRYMDHLKGTARKQSGASHDHPRMAKQRLKSA